MDNLMDNWNIFEILKLGLPGLVFLLSVLTYRLLAKEQEKVKADDGILKLIKQFMYFNAVFAFFTLASPIIDYMFFRVKTFDIEATIGNSCTPGKAAVCQDVDYANRYLLIKDKRTNALVQVFANTVIPCSGAKQIVLSKSDTTGLGWTLDVQKGKIEVTTALPGYKFEINKL